MNELIERAPHLKLLVVTPPAQQVLLNAELIPTALEPGQSASPMGVHRRELGHELSGLGKLHGLAATRR